MQEWQFVIMHYPCELVDWAHVMKVSSALHECVYLPMLSGGGCWFAVPVHGVTTILQLLSWWGILSWGGFVFAGVPWVIPWFVHLFLP